jgi:hypothetical protein
LAARLTREHLASSHDFILRYLMDNQATAGGIDQFTMKATLTS